MVFNTLLKKLVLPNSQQLLVKICNSLFVIKNSICIADKYHILCAFSIQIGCEGTILAYPFT